MYRPDLSPYTYLGKELPGVLAIGWLDRSEPFVTGSVNDDLISRLSTLCVTQRVNQTRGYHMCPFCPQQESMDLVRPTIVDDGKKVTLGSAEVWVPGEHGRILAAPNLVHHYIVRHHYLPPKEWLDAVEAVDTRSSWRGDDEFHRRVGMAFATSARPNDHRE